jgi:hypothetical protein
VGAGAAALAPGTAVSAAPGGDEAKGSCEGSYESAHAEFFASGSKR